MSKRSQKENKRGIFEFLSVKAELPSDALIGDVRIELRGRSMMLVGGCRRIEKYTPGHIILAIRGDTLSIKGNRLICSSYYNGNVSVEGNILSVSFGEEQK